MKKITIVASVLLLAFFARSAFSGTHTAQAKSGETLSQTEAIEIMRAVGTAEAESIALSGHAMNMQAVSEHRFAKRLDPQIGLNNQLASDSDSVLVKGYEIRLLLAQDQRHYTLTIHPLQQNDCTIFMTNETGVMYQGAAIVCQ